MVACPLCSFASTGDFHEDQWRQYRRCDDCRLIFVPPEYHLAPADEKAEYDLHENSPDDLRYRAFLSRVFKPLQALLGPGSRGLDFGCGPGPTLSVMFEEAGHSVELYDPFYAPDPAPLQNQFDFVTATEVVEHFRNPRRELDRLWSCVRPRGMLGIMTKLARDQTAFANWHYKNDRTHVSFFSRETFEWLADQWQASVSFPDRDVILLRRTCR